MQYNEIYAKLHEPRQLPNSIQSIKQKYSDAKAITSPIILDLDGDGVETTAVGSGAWFDHDANGFAESTGWAGSDDGILVRDLDGNGTIDSGRELFGSETLLANGTKATNGFAALAELDSNADGKIDANDAAFTTLKIWKDTDGDGTTDAGELLTLAEAGVQSLNVGYTASTAIDANGNQHQQLGSYTTTTGTTRAAEDVWFKVDKVNTIAENWVAVSADIAALPDVTGYGNVYDLHQAMARDTTGQLKALVAQFSAATDTATRDGLVEQILYQWVGANSIAPDSRGPCFDARRLAVLESFMGEAYTSAGCTGTTGNTPHDMSAPPLRQAWSMLVELVSSQLSAQTVLKPLYDQITYTWDDASQSLKGGLTQVIAALDAGIATDPAAGQALLVEFARSIHGMGSEAQLDYAGLRAHYAADPVLARMLDYSETLTGSSGNDVIDGGNGNDMIAGNAGDDTLIGGEGDDYLDGGAGADTLSGGVGDDVLGGDHWASDFYGAGNTYAGGTGNDELRGTINGDTYIFNLGDGKDSIHDYSNGNVAQDTIRFGAGISASSVTVKRNESHLILEYGTQDQITVLSRYASNFYMIERIEFADGTVWNGATLQAMSSVIHGTQGNDSMAGYAGSDIFYGEGGSDTLLGNAGNDVLDGGNGDDNLYGHAGDDTLLGQAGNDMLDGGDGNDILDGGTGNDTLTGGNGDDTLLGQVGNDTLTSGAGNDTYIYHRGDGIDTIDSYDATAGKLDTLNLADLMPADISLQRGGVTGLNDLIVYINGTNDYLRLKSYFSGSAYRIEQIQFADGTVWNYNTVIGQSFNTDGTAAADSITGYDGGINHIYGYDGNDSLSGGNLGDMLDGGNGADSLYGNAGNDTLLGQTGDDTLNGGDGNDILDGGIGNDILTGSNSNDTLTGGAGNDTLTGGAGNDTYIYRRGDGIDTIDSYDSVAGKVDTLQLADINPADITLQRASGTAARDLLIYIQGTSDYLRLKSYFSGSAYRIELIQFADGTVWNYNTVIGQSFNTDGTAAADSITGYDGGINRIYGYDGNDTLSGGNLGDILDGGNGTDNLYGNAGNDILLGQAGDDTLDGGDGNDVLDGSIGNDTLRGGNGNDTFTGGTGNDALTGGAGNDTYIYRRGDGIDLIDSYDATAGKVDTLNLADLMPADISLQRGGVTGLNDLIVYIKGTSDYLRLKSYFSASAYRIDQIQFADGTTWNYSAVIGQSFNTEGTAAADSITGYDGGINHIYGYDGNDTLSGGNLGDMLDGGNGADNLYGNAGNDVLQGASGNDILSDTVGSNLFDGGAGTDTITGNTGSELIVGGLGNDTITTNTGFDVIAFNKGDGADILNVSTGADNTISLGGGITYADLALSKSGTDLILKAGATDQVTIKGWYASTTNHSVLNLQVIAEAMADFAPGGSDVLKDNKVETFNFAGLVGAFDTALVANPTMTSWSMTNALLNFHLGSGSDTAAIGGDLAYQYGKAGTLAGIGLNAVQSVISAPQFGQSAQTLNASSTWQSETVKLG